MVENPSVKDERNGSAITEDEAALYDRQIRLWGLDAQKRYYCAQLFCANISIFKNWKLLFLRKEAIKSGLPVKILCFTEKAYDSNFCDFSEEFLVLSHVVALSRKYQRR